MQFINRAPFTIYHFTRLGSTNDYLKKQLDAPEFTCVIADEQTAGRGRRTRTWVSPPGAGLYLSVLLCPPTVANSASLSLLAAVTVAETIAEYKVAALDIKWPNDVLIGERKVCGILVEGASGGTPAQRIIVGIGVNLNQQQFPTEISAIATSLALQLGRTVNVDEFRDRLLRRLAHWYNCWQGDAGRSVIDRWQQLSSYARGQQVAVNFDDGHLTGATAGLTKDGALILRLPDGTTRVLLSGEVTRLRKNP